MNAAITCKLRSLPRQLLGCLCPPQAMPHHQATQLPQRCQPPAASVRLPPPAKKRVGSCMDCMRLHGAAWCAWGRMRLCGRLEAVWGCMGFYPSPHLPPLYHRSYTRMSSSHTYITPAISFANTLTYTLCPKFQCLTSPTSLNTLLSHLYDGWSHLHHPSHTCMRPERAL